MTGVDLDDFLGDAGFDRDPEDTAGHEWCDDVNGRCADCETEADR